jgi:hypothetical protein
LFNFICNKIEERTSRCTHTQSDGYLAKFVCSFIAFGKRKEGRRRQHKRKGIVESESSFLSQFSVFAAEDTHTAPSTGIELERVLLPAAAIASGKKLQSSWILNKRGSIKKVSRPLLAKYMG